MTFFIFSYPGWFPIVENFEWATPVSTDSPEAIRFIEELDASLGPVRSRKKGKRGTAASVVLSDSMRKIPLKRLDLMGVLIEAISVVIRCRSILEKLPGGVEQFLKRLPNKTLRSDGKLACVHLMNRSDTKYQCLGL